MKPEYIRVALTRSDGSLAILSFITKGAINARGDIFQREASDEAIQAECDKMFGSSNAPVVSWRRINESDIPIERDFRDAWIDDGQSVTHDLNKARVIFKNKIREKRPSLFSELDAQYLKALETNDDVAKQQIVDQKQILRDATEDPRIQKCKTIEELRSLDPLSDVPSFITRIKQNNK